MKTVKVVKRSDAPDAVAQEAPKFIIVARIGELEVPHAMTGVQFEELPKAQTQCDWIWNALRGVNYQQWRKQAGSDRFVAGVFAVDATGQRTKLIYARGSMTCGLA